MFKVIIDYSKHQLFASRMIKDPLMLTFGRCSELLQLCVCVWVCVGGGSTVLKGINTKVCVLELLLTFKQQSAQHSPMSHTEVKLTIQTQPS